MVYMVPSIKTITLSIKKGIPEGALEAVRKGFIVFMNPWDSLVAPEPFYNHGNALLFTRLLAGQYLDRLLSKEIRPKARDFEVGRIHGNSVDDSVRFDVKFGQWIDGVSVLREVTFIALKDPSWTGK
jgi:hypothetical protein